jgi:hypothetical protein
MTDFWTSELIDVEPPENIYRVSTTLFVEGKLWTVNSERSEHYTVHRKRTREWRQFAGFAALHAKLPRMEWCIVHAVPFQPKGVLADCGSHFPPLKATIDGIVDAGLLPDDGPEYVRAITMAAPRRDKTEPEGLLLVINGHKAR